MASISRVTARAILLGAAAGDAVGWPQEGRGGIVGGRKAREARRPMAEYSAWIRNGGTRFARYLDPVDAGEYSDDTQLTFAVARSCLAGDQWLSHLTNVELPAWPLYQRGGGRAVLSAASAWAQGRPPWIATNSRENERRGPYYSAGANGVAMRIAPHVIWEHARGGSVVDVFQRVVRDGATTHGHPRAIVGALAFSAVLYYAVSTPGTIDPFIFAPAAEAGLIPFTRVAGWLPKAWFEAREAENIEDTWNQTNAEMYALLRKVTNSLQQGSVSNVAETLRDLGAVGEFAGSGTITAASAIYLASRSGTRPISGLLQGAFQEGADTDTLASMTGALLGAVHGDQWLGQLHAVQDAEYIDRLAAELASGTDTRNIAKTPLSSRIVERDLDEREKSGGIFADGRQYRVVRRGQLSENPWVVRIQLELEDGQHVLVDRLRKSPPVSPERLYARAAPAPAAQQPISDTLVVLPTSSLTATADFYGRVFGREVEIQGQRALVASHLAFDLKASQPTLWTSDAQIDLVVSDLSAVAARLESKPQSKDGIQFIVTIDPDGRSVSIRGSR